MSGTVRRPLLMALLIALSIQGPTVPHAAAQDSGEQESLTLAEVHAKVNLMLFHLNEALFALSGNDIRVTRSQYKQFFDQWDAVEDQLSALYPEQYDALELEFERAQNALFGQFPEDIDAARLALRALRAGLLEIAQDLEAQLESN